MLKSKLSTYREDIINANKAKILELLERNRDVLDNLLKSHSDFLKKIKPEFEKCRESIKEAIVSFKRHTVNETKNIYEMLFNDLADRSDDIIEENFGDKEAIRYRIESAFERLAEDAQSELDKSMEENLETLRSQLKESIDRLIEDANRINIEMSSIDNQLSSWSFYHRGNLGWDIDLKDFGSIAFQIASYGVSGFAVGSALPGIGQLVGTVVGVVMGAIMSLVHLLSSKKRRIRKAQLEVRKKLSEEKNNKKQKTSEEIKELVSSIKNKIDEELVKKINNLEESLYIPIEVIKRQIAELDGLKNKIRKVNYGAVEAI